MARAGNDEREFPTEIHGIAKTAVESLAQERRRLMSGISGEEHAAGLPAHRGRRMKLVDSGAPYGVVLVWEPGIEKRPDPLWADHLLGRLVRQELKLPASIRIFDTHIGRESRGIADLHHVEGESGLRTLCDVDDEPVLVVVEAAPFDADRSADEAIGAVATDRITGLDRGFRAALHIAKPNHDAIRILIQRNRFLTEPHVDPLFLRHEAAQRGLELRLVEEDDVAPAVRAPMRHVDAEEGLVLRVREADPLWIARRLAEGVDLVREAKPLKGAETLTVESDGTWQLDLVGRALEDDDLHSRSRECQGGHRADRSIAHDGDIVCVIRRGLGHDFAWPRSGGSGWSR